MVERHAGQHRCSRQSSGGAQGTACRWVRRGSARLGSHDQAGAFGSMSTPSFDRSFPLHYLHPSPGPCGCSLPPATTPTCCPTPAPPLPLHPPLPPPTPTGGSAMLSLSTPPNALARVLPQRSAAFRVQPLLPQSSQLNAGGVPLAGRVGMHVPHALHQAGSTRVFASCSCCGDGARRGHRRRAPPLTAILDSSLLLIASKNST